MKIITIGTFVGFCNRGAEALLKTRVESIKKLVPDVKFYVLSIYTETCKPIDNLEYIDTFGGRVEKLKSIKYFISSAYKGFSWTVNALMYRLFKICFDKDHKFYNPMQPLLKYRDEKQKANHCPRKRFVSTF